MVEVKNFFSQYSDYIKLHLKSQNKKRKIKTFMDDSVKHSHLKCVSQSVSCFHLCDSVRAKGNTCGCIYCTKSDESKREAAKKEN